MEELFSKSLHYMQLFRSKVVFERKYANFNYFFYSADYQYAIRFL